MAHERVIALGFFDGVHLGHAALLRRTAERAAALGATAAAYTFDVHPGTVISGEPQPLLTGPEERRTLMAELYGIREVVVDHFDVALMSLPWRKFVTDRLVGELHACHVVAGHDYRFGCRGEGDAGRLQTLCRELGVGCDIIPPVRLDGVTVSSTLIRDLVARGELEEAARFLGHPHTLLGTVIHGKGLGHSLNFPTVNLAPEPGLLLPAYGVYASRVRLPDGTRVEAVTNIGVRPTVDDGAAPSIESFLLDYRGDLYGTALRLELYRYLRPERQFDALDELRREVMANAGQTREYFAQRTDP